MVIESIKIIYENNLSNHNRISSAPLIVKLNQVREFLIFQVFENLFFVGHKLLQILPLKNIFGT